MKKKLIISTILILIVGMIAILFHKKNDSVKDENTLYSIEFNNEILRFERYDYALGQKQVVGVEASSDKGKTFKKVTKEPILVSMEPKFIFLNEKLGFAIASLNLSKKNGYLGLIVTNDGGATFIDSEIIYENLDIEMITIEDTPRYEENVLKLPCSIYHLKEDKNSYEDVKLIFISKDEGLTWELSEKDNRKNNMLHLLKSEMMSNNL